MARAHACAQHVLTHCLARAARSRPRVNFRGQALHGPLLISKAALAAPVRRYVTNPSAGVQGAGISEISVRASSLGSHAGGVVASYNGDPAFCQFRERPLNSSFRARHSLCRIDCGEIPFTFCASITAHVGGRKAFSGQYISPCHHAGKAYHLYFKTNPILVLGNSDRSASLHRLRFAELTAATHRDFQDEARPVVLNRALLRRPSEHQRRTRQPTQNRQARPSIPLVPLLHNRIRVIEALLTSERDAVERKTKQPPKAFAPRAKDNCG